RLCAAGNGRDWSRGAGGRPDRDVASHQALRTTSRDRCCLTTRQLEPVERTAMPPQTYANHRRFFPLFHFFALPIVVLNVLMVFGGLLRHPSLGDVWPLVFAIGVAAGFLACRASIVTVQDR